MNVAPALTGLALLAAVLYLLLSVFLNGGIIGCLNRPEARTTLADFFHDCGLYFWRFFRLFLLSIPVYLLVLGIFFPLIRTSPEDFHRRATTEWPALIVSNLRILGAGPAADPGGHVLRLRQDRPGDRRQQQGAERDLADAEIHRAALFQGLGLYLLAGLVFVALTFFYLEIARVLPKNRPLLVLLVFLWQQAYILCRQWSKLLFFATELELSKHGNDDQRRTDE